MKLSFEQELHNIKQRLDKSLIKMDDMRTDIYRDPKTLLSYMKQWNKEHGGDQKLETNLPYLNFEHKDLVKQVNDAQDEIIQLFGTQS